MDTVVVFADKREQACYEELATADVRIEVMQNASPVPLIGEGDIGLAIIDSGDDAQAGLHLLEEIKQCRPDVPVIFITGASSEAVVMGAFKLGARDYFRQPFDPALLEETVVKILRFKRMQLGKPELPGEEQHEIPELIHLPDKLPERLLRAISYINLNLSSPLCLDRLAEQACLSKYHFCRLFKQHVGVSPMQYCVCRRIETARELLGRPDQTISLTAYRLGFNDISDFIRQFKKLTGITPGAYRQALRLATSSQ